MNRGPHLDAIGQDADSVVTGKKMSESVIQLYLAKNRHGSSGRKLYVNFQPAKGIFEECSYDRAMALKDMDADNADREQSKPIRTPKARTMAGTDVRVCGEIWWLVWSVEQCKRTIRTRLTSGGMYRCR